MKSLMFFRFKKKTLTLAYKMYPEELVDVFKEIKYKKLFQCCLNQDFNLSKIFTEKTLNGHTLAITSIIKLSNTKIASASSDYSIKVWVLPSGACIRSYRIGKDLNLVKISQTQILSWDSYDF